MTQSLNLEDPVPSTKSGFDAIANEIVAALKGLRFGSVEIVVHDSKVVQISRTEKFRPLVAR